mgnify:CR=1 FL=1
MCVFCLVSAQYDLTVKPASLLFSKGCLFVIDVSDEYNEATSHNKRSKPSCMPLLRRWLPGPAWAGRGAGRELGALRGTLRHPLEEECERAQERGARGDGAVRPCLRRGRVRREARERAHELRGRAASARVEEETSTSFGRAASTRVGEGHCFRR